MGIFQTIKSMFEAPIKPQAPPRPAVTKVQDKKSPPTLSERQAIALEMIAAEAAGGSHWVEGSAVAEAHGVSVFDVHSEYMAALDKRDRYQMAAVTIDTEPLVVCDLREVASTRTRIKGVSFYVSDEERSEFGGQAYLLIREPENDDDGNAVAVYGKGRKLGYISSAKSASFAPLLDTHGADAFLIGGENVTEASNQLWIDLPNVVALRKFTRAT
jgi:hypothetical protein